MNEGAKERVVENIWDEVKYLAIGVYKKTTIAILIASAVLIFLFPLSLFIIAVYYGFLYEKASKTFMQHFAKTNGFHYEEMALRETASGRLFGVGTNRHISHVLLGKYQNYPIRIFNYEYVIGSGKHRQTYYFTVLEISFEKTKFPHILLQSDKMWRHSYRDYLGEVKDTQIHVQGQFEDHFKLYATKGYEVEVLEIFTPDLLMYLVEKAKYFNIEFSDNKITIFDDTTLSTKKELDLLFEIAKKILGSHGEIIDRLHDDFSALHPYYKEK